MARSKNLKNWLQINCKHCSSLFECRISKPRLFCSKKCSNNDLSTKQKIIDSQKKTFDEKYGGHPMTTDEVKTNFKSSLYNKYGVDSYSKLPDFKLKVKKTLLERYGDENYSNVDKIKSTMMERYGVDNAAKLKSVVDKRTNTKKSNHYDFLVNYCNSNNLEFICSEEEYKGYHFTNIYKFNCKVCNKNFESTVYNLNNLFCDYCYPEKITTVENQFYKFLQDTLSKETIIKRNDRTILNGKELDFYIPDLKIAFEINGLYWHSENGGGINKNYHLNKTKSCSFYGISLIHIFENEWIYKSEIVKSIIRTMINTSTIRKINARECKIEEVNESEKNIFLNENHLQGEDKSTIKLGLYYKKELISIMTFRKTSRFDKTSDWELVRFCNKLNTLVNGGASKLLKHFVKNYKPKNVVSYSDRRYFTGKIYKTLGFNFVSHTPPNYHYIINNYKDIRHRMSFQKHKLQNILKTYNPLLSEWENMKNNGYDRIWDCGHGKYFLIIN
jgi:endogenous inhibitor of DNA gyrase (YacG/DUF329 family)